LTSQAISEGARQAGCHVIGPSSLELKSPIANSEEYEKALASGQTDRIVSDWLNGIDSQGAMVPARRYAKEIYRSLLGADLCVPDAATVIATHDLHILPLSRYFLASSPSGVDYLNGVVLKVNGDQVKIGFNATVFSVQLNELLHSNSGVNEKREGQLLHSE
jgi:hypothetical protein